MYEVYRNKRDRNQRMAVWIGAGLPPHTNRLEWELLLPDTQQLKAGAEEDILIRGYSLFRMSDAQ